MLTMRKEIDTVASIEKLGGPSGDGAGSGEDNLDMAVSTVVVDIITVNIMVIDVMLVNNMFVNIAMIFLCSHLASH